MLMNTILFTIVLFIIGAALGSFAVATVWRLRVWQLDSDKKQGEKLTKAEQVELTHLMKLRGKKTSQDRSVCLYCGRQLKVQDLIPVVSWLWLRGKCRTCKKPIGRAEVLAEVGLGVVLAASFLAWPFTFTEWQGVALFAVWTLILVALTIHVVYDAKWFLLLDTVTITLGILAVIFVGLRLATGIIPVSWGLLQPIVGALLILPGLYGVLYIVSKGKWIGLGDVKLLVPLALMLPDWTQAILVLFLANVLGCIWIIPGMLAKTITRTTRIPFGPFLIVAWIVAMLWGGKIISTYMGTVWF